MLQHASDMTIEIPDKFIARSGRTEDELKLKLAIFLFQEEVFTLGQASQFAELHQIAFQRELARREIPLHYGLEELRDDVDTIKDL